ncbi:hypothetical protein EAX61_06270 [Dokdonia sinensis]|uniref:Peptidase S8/S53 domain-containing protein n=1 Tax=Dokdonia sinensis TaxID=2479847 RepID=A0A3M0GIZ9_9FLAO|nr:S8/S53 family peptidase [Dokdonia sinensis]RMB61079.1 hypothetical protein EAX61_06270 [Dokdonia sinensis]
MRYSLVIALVVSFFAKALLSSLYAQDDRFYIRAVTDDIEIPTSASDSVVSYEGTDTRLQKLFNKHNVKVFRRGFKFAERDKLKRTFFGIATTQEFQSDLLKLTDLFEFGESFTAQSLKIYEPNDYGQTSVTGQGLGANAFLDYYDFIDVPKAWYYTTGSPDIIVGISDAIVDPDDPEFAGKTKQITKSSYSHGHGMSVGATAVANGDNGIGIPGVCYDCSVVTANYGSFKELKPLVTLANAGARVINCSWGSTRYYDTAQEVIYELAAKGVVVVSLPHNKSYNKTKGKMIHYPGGYDKVINVGSIQHRNPDALESVKIEERNGKYYFANVANYLGAHGGFKDNDLTKEMKFYEISINNLDSTVDIMAPGTFIFRYGRYAENKREALYNLSPATSPSAPLVTGTIGLMLSLNPCLSVDEVDSIIKLTSTNIDSIYVNKPYYGKYGAGTLNTGRAVKMVHNMLEFSEYATIQNQDFARWDLTMDAPYKVKLREVRFRESVNLNITAREEIKIEEETVLLPSENGSIFLGIDPKARYDCKNFSQ